MPGFFENAIRTLFEWGFLDVVLPFILIFTIIYASLERTKILGSKITHLKKGETDFGSPKHKEAMNQMKKFNLIISLVFGGLVVIPHVIWSTGTGQLSMPGVGTFPDAVFIINNSLPSIAGLVIAFLLAILLMEMFDAKKSIGGSKFLKKWSGWLTLLAILFVAFIFLNAGGYFRGASRFTNLLGLNNPGTAAAIIVIVVFGLIIKYVMKD